jgi:hypothetical protein
MARWPAHSTLTRGSDSLDLAVDALELQGQGQGQGRTVGVISHVQAMKHLIPVQVEGVKMGGGASELRLSGCMKSFSSRLICAFHEQSATAKEDYDLDIIGRADQAAVLRTSGNAKG